MVASQRRVTLCALVLMVLLGGAYAHGDDVLVPYQATGWRYMQVPTNDPLVGEFWRLDFDDSAWPMGQGAFGNGHPMCALSSTVHTQWAAETEMLLRRKFTADPLQPVTVHFAIDNDAVIYVNEVLIASVTHEGCPHLDEFNVIVPDDVIVAGENTLAVRAIDRGGVSFIDVRVVVTPTFAQECPEPVGWWYEGSSSVVAASGWHAYTGDQMGTFRVFDVSDPSAPNDIGGIGLPGEVDDIDVSGEFAYVIAAEWLWVINVSDPSNPDWVGFQSVPGAVAVAVSGSHAYVAAGDAGLRVIDVSNPPSPSEVGSCGATEWEARDVSVSDGHAYVVEFDALRVIDVSIPASPAEVASTGEWGGGSGVVVSDGSAYVWQGRGWRIIDVSNPLSPFLEWEQFSWSHHSDIAVSNHTVYLCVTSSNQIPMQFYLGVIDVSDPASPVGLGSYHSSGTARSVALSHGYAYLADGDGGMGVLRGCTLVMFDGFESGDCSAWSAVGP